MQQHKKKRNRSVQMLLRNFLSFTSRSRWVLKLSIFALVAARQLTSARTSCSHFCFKFSVSTFVFYWQERVGGKREAAIIAVERVDSLETPSAGHTRKSVLGQRYLSYEEEDLLWCTTATTKHRPSHRWAPVSCANLVHLRAVIQEYHRT